MNAHGRKMAAPLIVTACLISYYVAVAVLLAKLNVPVALKIAAAVISCVVSALFIRVLVERIKEIRKGKKMILVNTDYISGKELETLGLVKGSTIQSKTSART
jgi:hypothetical protein